MLLRTKEYPQFYSGISEQPYDLMFEERPEWGDVEGALLLRATDHPPGRMVGTFDEERIQRSYLVAPDIAHFAWAPEDHYIFFESLTLATGAYECRIDRCPLPWGQPPLQTTELHEELFSRFTRRMRKLKAADPSTPPPSTQRLYSETGRWEEWRGHKMWTRDWVLWNLPHHPRTRGQAIDIEYEE